MPLGVQLYKNITKCLLFIIIHIFSTHFAINLFYLRNMKTQTNYGTTTESCMWTNEIKTKNKTKSRHIQVDLALYCSIQPTNNAMVSLKYGFTVDQAYSNTRVPTQVNTNQHESTRINTIPTRVNTNQHESDTNQHDTTRVNTSQLGHEIITFYRSLVGKLW